MKYLLLVFLSALTYTSSGQTLETNANKRPYKKRNVFSFIPGKVDQINGLALGLWAENTNDYLGGDSLKINGLSVEVNPILLFIYIRGVFSVPHQDSIEYYLAERKKNYKGLTVKGLNLNVPGSINFNATISGFNVSGLTMVTGKLNGVSISGLTYSSYILNGVSVAGIYNSATKVKGLQIGLFNRASQLRGFQLGLWNRNGRRSLPIINWQFKDKKGAKVT